MHKEFQLPSRVYGYETIGMGINFDVGGGQGGEVNSPRNVVSSSPMHGLSLMNESFGSMMVKLCSALWFLSLREVWFAFTPRKLCSPPGFATLLLVVSVGGLVYL